MAVKTVIEREREREREREPDRQTDRDRERERNLMNFNYFFNYPLLTVTRCRLIKTAAAMKHVLPIELKDGERDVKRSY